jgi:hypothetical protein
MKLESKAFENKKQIPTRYTCDGENIHPPLEIIDQPKHTRSLCLIMDDIDATDEAGWNFLHWTMWNIRPHTTSIQAGEVPLGVTQGKTSFGNYHYGGPCPPGGKVHCYRFRLFALSKELEVSPDSSAEELEEEIAGHILDKTELFGTYDRNGLLFWKKPTEKDLGEKPEESRMPPPEESGYGEE